MFGSEFLKPLEGLFEQDPRHAAFARVDPSTGSIRPKSLEDHYSDIEALSLPYQVPEDIRLHFDTSRNLFLYSWFLWRFAMVAQLYSYVSLELALRHRAMMENQIVPDSTPGLARLLALAIKHKWIVIRDLPEYIALDLAQKAALERWSQVYSEPELASIWAPQVDPNKYSEMVAKVVPSLRNELAHGTTFLFGNPYATLVRCRDMISQLFPLST
jgi:hypothetical protein